MGMTFREMALGVGNGKRGMDTLNVNASTREA